MPSNKGSSWGTKGALGMAAFYSYYKNHVSSPVSKSVYGTVLRECNKEFMRLIVEEGKTMRIPYLSTLGIRKAKEDKTTINFDEFNKTGKKVPLDNSHSDGYIGRFHWSKNQMPLPGAMAYSFKPARDIARALSKEFKKFNGHSKYIERLRYGK